MNIKSQHCDVQFFLRQGKNKRYGTVYVRVVYGGDRQEIGSTGVRIEEQFWDASRRIVRASCPLAEAHNRALDRTRHEIDNAYIDLLRRARPVSAGAIKAHYLDNDGGALTMSGAIAWFIERKTSEMESGRITRSSLKTFARQGRNVQAFLHQAKLTQQLVEEFTPSVVDKMVSYFVKQKKYVAGYTNKHLHLVKAMLRAAYEADRIPKNPLKRYPDLPEGEPDTTYLTDDEVNRIEALTDLSPRLDRCRDFLLFCIEAGTHYVDYVGLVKGGHIDVDPDGSRWLISYRRKTGTPIEVPVTCRIDRLIKKYGALGRLPVLANAQFNAFLKVVGDRARIDKELTTKIGRKTFADGKLNRDGISRDVTAQLLGLKGTKYLDHYGKGRRDRVKAALLKNSSE